MNCYLVRDAFKYHPPQTNNLKNFRHILSSIFLESDQIFDLLVDSSCVDLVWTGGWNLSWNCFQQRQVVLETGSEDAPGAPGKAKCPKVNL